MSLAIQTRTFPMPTSPPTEREWEDQRDRIHQLYIIEDKPLRDVMHILRQDGFRGTAKMYKTRLAKWRFVKNNKLGDMKSVLAKIMQQRTIDSDATLQIDGRLVQVKEVERYFRRKGFLQLQDAARYHRLYRVASPANAVTVPEQIMISLTTYYANYRGAMSSPIDHFNSSICDSENKCFDFTALWVGALFLAKDGSFADCRQALSTACLGVPQMVKAQSPILAHTMLEMLISYAIEGFYDLAVLVLRHVYGMAANYLSCTHPFTFICDKLLQLESGLISHVAQATTKLVTNTSRLRHRNGIWLKIIIRKKVTIQLCTRHFEFFIFSLPRDNTSTSRDHEDQ